MDSQCDFDMPFTPYYLGPCLVIWLPLKKVMHMPTFVLATVVLDVEPLSVLLLGLNYPLHGFIHTFFTAFLVGAGLGCLMLTVEPFLTESIECCFWNPPRKLR